MASTRKLNKKDGTPFYEIIVSRGRGRSQLTTRWYPPAGWSQKVIDRELIKVASEFERQVKAGEIVSKTEQAAQDRQKAAEAAQIKTVKQYAESVYMPALAIRCAENTRASYQGNFDKWIYPALGDFKLPDVTAAQISALLLSMQAQGKSHGTVIKTYTVLQGLFKMAYMADLIDRNPMGKVQRPKPRKDETKPTEAEAYTAEEIRHICSCLSQEPLKWRTLVRLLIDTGIRRGECCGLQWKDVDFIHNTITICGNLCYTPAKGVYMDTPKNGRHRTIDVDPQVIALLHQLRLSQVRSVLSPYVFTQEGSTEPMHPQSPARYLQGFSKRYGVADLHPHKLRHSFASIAITNGADIASVSEKLGHTDKAVTLRMYTHADQESIKKASQIFRNAIKQA
ncbi:MAG: site-specific integrase [Oscillospiraceae bacterium]|nr:site-specific integrase [Oscillospiraceae bacterium]